MSAAIQKNTVNVQRPAGGKPGVSWYTPTPLKATLANSANTTRLKRSTSANVIAASKYPFEEPRQAGKTAAKPVLKHAKSERALKGSFVRRARSPSDCRPGITALPFDHQLKLAPFCPTSHAKQRLTLDYGNVQEPTLITAESKPSVAGNVSLTHSSNDATSVVGTSSTSRISPGITNQFPPIFLYQTNNKSYLELDDETVDGPALDSTTSNKAFSVFMLPDTIGGHQLWPLGFPATTFDSLNSNDYACIQPDPSLTSLPPTPLAITPSLRALFERLFLSTIPAERRQRPQAFNRWFWGAFRRSITTKRFLKEVQFVVDSRKDSHGTPTQSFVDLTYEIASTLELWLKEAFLAEDVEEAGHFQTFIDQEDGPIPVHRRGSLVQLLQKAAEKPALYEWPVKCLIGMLPEKPAPTLVGFRLLMRPSVAYFASSQEGRVAFAQQLSELALNQYSTWSISDICTEYLLVGAKADILYEETQRLARQISDWSERSVSNARSEEKRISFLEFWTRVAAALRQLRNFYASHAVFAGLSRYWKKQITLMTTEPNVSNTKLSLQAPDALSARAIDLFNREQRFWNDSTNYWNALNNFDEGCTITIPVFAYHRKEWLQSHLMLERISNLGLDTQPLVERCIACAGEIQVLETHRLGSFEPIPEVQRWMMKKLDACTLEDLLKI